MNFVNHTLWGEFFPFFFFLPPVFKTLKKISVRKWTDALLEFIFEIDGVNKKIFPYQLTQNWKN